MCYASTPLSTMAGPMLMGEGQQNADWLLASSTELAAMATASQSQHNGSFNLDPTSALYLFSFLGPQDLCSAAMVCREWRSTTNEPSLWRDLLESNPQPMLSSHQPVYLASPPQAGSRQVAGKGRVPPTWLEVPPSSPLGSPAGGGQLAANHTFRFRELAGQGQAGRNSVGQGLGPLARRGPVGGGQVATYKQVYSTSEAWRKGTVRARRLAAKGSDRASAVRIAPSGRRMVFASGGRGSCIVFDVQTGKRCSGVGLPGSQEPEDQAYEDLHGLYACSAISGDCETVGFGGFDGTVMIYDITGGKLRATLGGVQHRAAAQSLAISWDGSIVAAGLSDGHLALGRTRQLASREPSPDEPQGFMSSLGEGEGDVASGDWWMVRQLGTGLAVTCLEPNLAGFGQGSDKHCLAVGTSGGHVMVVDGETGDKKASMVGSCSCPVSSLCIHAERNAFSHGGRGSQPPCDGEWDASGRLVYAAFNHHNTGNGHSNAVYVWDMATAERVALLHPGGGGGARQTRGGRGVGFLSGGPVKSVFADGHKVVVTAGKAATVFETRTWQVLYEFNVSHRTLREGEVGVEDEGDEEETGEERDTDWFWNLAEGEGGGGGHVTASGIESCISPRPMMEAEQFQGFSPRVPVSPSNTRFGSVNFPFSEATSSSSSGPGLSPAMGIDSSLPLRGPLNDSGAATRISHALHLDASPLPHDTLSERHVSLEDRQGIMAVMVQADLVQPRPSSGRTPPPTPVPISKLDLQTVFSGFHCSHAHSASSPGSPSSSHPIARSSTLPDGQSLAGSWSSRMGALPTSRHGKSEHPMLAANQRRILIRTNSDGDLRASLSKPSPRRSFEEHTDEPAHQRVHFVGSQLVMALKGGAVGLVTFGDSLVTDGSADIHVTHRLVT